MPFKSGRSKFSSRVFVLLGVFALAMAALLIFGVIKAFSMPAPLGLQMLCLTDKEVCKSSSHGEIHITDENMKIIRAVNLKVNKSIKPRHDGKREYYSVNPKYGDCEDYVITKRVELVKAGIPAGALRLAKVKTESRQFHMVLLVKTSFGDLTLDNRTDKIKDFRKTRYSKITESTRNPLVWR